MKTLNELNLRHRYSTGSKNNPIDFFTKALSNSSRFDLGLGFFSSASINVLAEGFAHFIANGGMMRLYINLYISEDDFNAITSPETYAIDHILSDFKEMCKVLSKRDEHFFNCLSYLISNKRIELKVVIPKTGGIAHEKFGIFADDKLNKIAFSGSLNFTASALLRNIETIECNYSWEDTISNKKIQETEEDFDAIFTGSSSRVIIYDVTELKKEIIKRFPSQDIKQLLDEEKEIIAQEQLQPAGIEAQPSASIPRFPYDSGPRPYQKEAYDAWIKHNYQGIFAMATGTGKTITSLNCVLGEYQKTGKYRVLILVPILDLVDQWDGEVRLFNFQNIYKVSGNTNWRSSLTILKNDISWGIDKNFIIISTYQSFINALPIINELSDDMILIADEAHNVGSDSVREAFNKLEIKKRIALSATPKRNYDPEGTAAIELYFNNQPPYCYTFSMERAIDEGYLMKYLYYPRVVYLSSDEMRRYVVLTKKLLKFYDASTGEFSKNPEVERLLMDRKRIIHKSEDKFRAFGEILDELTLLNQAKYCFVYVPEGYKAPSEDAESKRIINRMIEITHSKYPDICTNTYLGDDKNKSERLRGFSEGRIDILFAMKCLDEGVDVPRAEVGVFASSTGNPRQFIQRRGRLLRKHEDKQFAKIYDMIVVPDFKSPIYDETYYEMEKSLVRSELIRVAYFASLATNYYQGKEMLEEILNFYNFEISTLILELQEQ
jgi:superfamily II DNA or RNA helicase/HKD family nuclease